MKTIREQLREYHAKQGLSGTLLAIAVGADSARVQANAAVSLGPEDELCGAFSWRASPEGRDYWSARQGWGQ